MSSSHVKSQRKCPSCGANLYVRKDVTETDNGMRRVDTMLVCRDESCTEPARHLGTELLQPA
ncbi:hypothetical protein GYA93_18995 [Gordonia desulfuricans]|uniref:Uncharacterized protein n=1 Tax=Gordonia desulfuricans TaxID=89051 RepID=A0A7K3LU78_9ACTN|nr:MULTISPECIES: hypothetical protein [Gordonia]EMP13577.1 hypothetical protein ISGA_1907 [Gordonia sp. NB41Y]NDK91646.1 hypothetical protein [Gordonia desulfuricans]WLP91246.1 hypothetical protein Q9K23_02930 [Gordonia sp. NB41Y]